jgi:PAS domain S-box-containing protein
VTKSIIVRTVWRALLVCVGCYAGASLGTWLRFPEIGTAVLFAPYAILTAALLLSPPREWWVYLLAAALGDFLPHLGGGAPFTFVLLAEIANFTRALVAVWGVRRFGDANGRLDTLRGMAVFLLFAAVLAPIAGACIGAGVVVLHHVGENYWLAWRSWLLSNTLTGLTILPVLLASVAEVGAPRKKAPSHRVLEAGFLALALAAVGHVVLEPTAMGATLPAPLYAPLPLLLWAAVRFGPRGTSASIFLVAFQAIDGALEGRGPFVTASPADNIFHLQLFLFVTSVPLLLLSALLQEQQQTAEALRASRQQYRAVVEDQTELICRFLPGGRLTFVNGAFSRSSMRPVEHLLGASFFDFVPEESRDDTRRMIEALDEARTVAAWEHEIAASIGETRWEAWRVRAIFDDGHRVVDYQAVGRDTTERKRAGEDRRLLEAEQALAAALREADRRKDEFLAMLAHELRNPLAPISTAVEILRMKPSTEQSRWARDVISRQLAQLKRLVDDLLDVSRITSGKIQLHMEPIALGDVIANAVETSLPLLSARGIVLGVDLPPAPLVVRGDAARLAQLVSNLLNNAAKYTEIGGRVALTVAEGDGTVVLRCSDTGVGIPSDMLRSVFEPFTQVEPSRDGALGGLGLGLTLVKRLAEMHGGTVEARSEGPGRGAEFVVRLPAWRPLSSGRDALAPSNPAATLDEPPPSSSRRVLVVDDAVDAAQSLALLISMHGHDVRVAHDGPTALDEAQRLDPEIVFLDLALPQMDGLEVARRLRRRFGPDRMLLVATTGFGQSDDRRRTSEAGFDHHLVKPIDPSKVEALLSGASE